MSAKPNIKQEAEQEGETPEYEQEEYDQNGDTGVTVPEDFQKKVHHVMESAKDKHHVAHIRSALNDKEEAMREAEMEAKSKKSKGGNKPQPDQYSVEGMPS